MDNWKTDILGEGFEMTRVPQPKDYTGDVRCTVVRHLAEGTAKKGVLYIHGFSDYFFQKEMAERFSSHGYNFYAVDLRRYGRSLNDGERMFRVRNMSEYFADIEAGISAMKEDGNTEIILIGHSTGGLTTTLYMEGHPDSSIKGLILNSPFLTWNLPEATVRYGIPVIKLISHVYPRFRVKGDGSNKYAASLARHLGGEWEYDTVWKPDIMPDVDAEWVKAIDDAQKKIRHGKVHVPVLFLHSDKSASKKDPMPMFRKADAVLNVRTMAEVGRALGPDVTEVTIHDGLHDLVLSAKEVREEVYKAIFEWLDQRFSRS